MRSYIFRVIYLALIINNVIRNSAQIWDEESISFRIHRLEISIYKDLCILPNRRPDNLREINQAERSPWIRRPRDQRRRMTKFLIRFRYYFSFELYAISIISNDKIVENQNRFIYLDLDSDLDI